MDPIGGKSFSQSYQCLGPTGRLVIYGFSAAAGTAASATGSRADRAAANAAVSSAEADGRQYFRDRRESRRPASASRALLQSEMDEIFRLYGAGKIKPVIGKTFPLAQAADAHHYIHDRKNIGKVILTVK